MNAQQEAVALWKYLEERKLMPSVRKVAAMMRAGGMPIDDKLARTCLAPFAAAAPHPRAFRQIFTASPPQEHRTKGAQPPHGHREDTAPASAVKVSLVSNSLPSVAEPEPLTLLPEPEAVSAKPAKPKREPSAADLAAYSLLSALWGRIGPLDGYTRKDWAAHNKRVALSMLASGVSEAEWLAFWDEAAEAGFRYVKLANMQANYASRSARHRDAEPEGEQYQSVGDLIAAGQIDADELRAGVAAERPAWFKPQMTEA